MRSNQAADREEVSMTRMDNALDMQITIVNCMKQEWWRGRIVYEGECNWN